MQKILSKQTVFQAWAFDVEKLDLVLPDGREAIYDRVKHANSVSVLPVNDEGQVLLVNQYRVGVEGDLLELPAGVIDAGEQPLEAAHRELREEVGMDCAEMIHLGGFYLVGGYCTEFMNVYLALGLKVDPLPADEDEFLTVQRMSLEEVYRLALSGTWADNKSVAIMFLALPHLLKRFPQLVRLMHSL